MFTNNLKQGLLAAFVLFAGVHGVAYGQRDSAALAQPMQPVQAQTKQPAADFPWMPSIDEVHGDFQTDAAYYRYDSKIGTPVFKQKIGNNNYLNLIYTRGALTVGGRFEAYQPVMQGFSDRYKGSGFQYRFINYKGVNFDITAGNIYEQFGSGMIFRTYQEWGLGFDNSLDGIRFRVKVLRGLRLKALAGRQRLYFDYAPGLVRGADAELNLNEALQLPDSAAQITFGAGVVSKYQAANDPIYNLPENVAAFSGRAAISKGSFSLNGEYAYKVNDPSYANGYIYKPGEGLFITGSYAGSTTGLTVSAKRIDNMDFRSDRNATLNDALMSFLPPITPYHTYRLATLYPYATQTLGEMGAQSDFFYNFKKGSLLGGAYGTNLQVNYSQINNIQKTMLPTGDAAGYSSNRFALGDDVYYRNLSAEVNKKISPALKGTLMYIYVELDNRVTKVTTYEGRIYSHIAIADLSFRVAKKRTLRTEVQHLYTAQDRGSWALGLLEYSIGHKYFLAVFDEYNYRNPDTDLRLHYPNFSAGYTQGTTRVTLGVGRIRSGVFCVGGVCRVVPSQNGVSMSITSSF